MSSSSAKRIPVGPLSLSRTHIHVLSAFIFLLSTATSSFAQKHNGTLTPPADPFADPKNDPFNPLRYIASNSLTAVSFSLVLLTAFIETFMMWRQGGQFMLSMLIAEYTFAAGLGTRFGLTLHPDSKAIYIVEYLLVVLSPCGFIASNYVLLGRISRWLKCDKYLLIPAKKITLVFVISDVVTFLIQAAGGSISISNNIKTAQNGAHIFLAGLALQLASFVLFTSIYVRFLVLVYKHERQTWFMDGGIKKWYNDWRSLAFALCISCVGILIRSVYRTVELGQGFHGKLATTEGYFYGLDTLPLFISIAIFVPFWPGRFIPPFDISRVRQEGELKVEDVSGNGRTSAAGSEGTRVDMEGVTEKP
ncbi:RTA1 like protein-domain-containing protein [Abortiporus biennis]|nr:RTA1 like protein-domain-containing protein [Abortiporus biennis]